MAWIAWTKLSALQQMHALTSGMSKYFILKPSHNIMTGAWNTPAQNPKHNEHLNNSLKKMLLLKTSRKDFRMVPYLSMNTSPMQLAK